MYSDYEKRTTERYLDKEPADCVSSNESCVPTQTIGWAVKQLWNGSLVRRRGWNGKGMHLALQVPDINSKMTMPYVYLKAACGGRVPWLCSQGDLLATDWEFAEV